jgi:hypothetical protein
MNRRERRSQDKDIQKRAEKFTAQKIVLSPNSGGGYGIPQKGAKPASGQNVQINPFVIPKSTGLNIFSQTFPNNYYVEWDLSSWRSACDQAIKMGYPISYSTLVSWAYECSSFIQSLFQEIAVATSKIPIQLIDVKGNPLDEWNTEIVQKKWFKDLLREVIFSFFWGFSGINFDPFTEQIYKYPMQDIDPINRYLRATTYNFFDGIHFADAANLLFFQPSTSYEAFLGWMQPITRSFIQMNLNSNNWVTAGKRLAFPLLTIGYPQGDNVKDSEGNEVNPAKIDAENIAANIDPSQAITYPYTIDMNGNIQKAIMVGEESTSGGTGSRHKIYQEFNNDEKNEIRELIFGGTLTSTTQGVGSQALGNIHYEKYQAQILYLIEQAVSMLNDKVSGFMGKIGTFYKNFPKDATLAVNATKQWDLEEISQLSPVLKLHGKKFTDSFFEEIGLPTDYFEEAPEPVAPSFGAPINESETATEKSRLILAMKEPEKKTILSALKKKVR